MAKKKSLEDLKKELVAIQSEIKIREDDLKYSIGAAVLAQINISSVGEFLDKYKLVRVENKKEEIKNV